jgi:hypothetical protein
MSATGLNAATLTRLPVRLKGGRRDEARGWHWAGRWEAEVPLVGLVMCEQAGVIHWARSHHRASRAGLEVLLHCTTRNLRLWAYCGLGPPSGRAFVQGYTDQNKPELPWIEGGAGSTGEVLRLARIAGEPALSLHVLLVARDDARSRRLGLWGVKPRLLEGVEEPWKSVLRYGRTGQIRCLDGAEGAARS